MEFYHLGITAILNGTPQFSGANSTPLMAFRSQSRVNQNYLKAKIHTSSTSFSRKGTSFSSSLSFLSMNQLSIGIPLESWKRHKSCAPVSGWHRALGYLCNVFLKHKVWKKGLPGKQRLEVSYQLLLSWKDLVQECLGLLYNFLEHKHSAHETACAWKI